MFTPVFVSSPNPIAVTAHQCSKTPQSLLVFSVLISSVLTWSFEKHGVLLIFLLGVVIRPHFPQAPLFFFLIRSASHLSHLSGPSKGLLLILFISFSIFFLVYCYFSKFKCKGFSSSFLLLFELSISLRYSLFLYCSQVYFIFLSDMFCCFKRGFHCALNSSCLRSHVEFKVFQWPNLCYTLHLCRDCVSPGSL